MITSSLAADRPERSWPIGFRRPAKTIACCCAKPARIPPTAECPRSILSSRFGIASRDPRFLWHQLRVTTEAIPHNDPAGPRPRRSATNRRACWAAVPRSMASSPIAARRRTTMTGKPRGAAAGGGTPCCRISGRSNATSISMGRCTAATAAFRCAGCFRITGPTTRKRSAKRSSWPVTIMCRTRMASSRTAIIRWPCRTCTTGGFRPRSAISGPTVRQRDNLTISTETQVSGLLFEDTVCVGIRAMVARQADGIPRPRGHPVLRRHSFARGAAAGRHRTEPRTARSWDPDARHLPGVGQRLMDHPSISVASYLHPGHGQIRTASGPCIWACGFPPGIEGAPPGDMALTVSNKSAWHAIGDRIASSTCGSTRRSRETGQVQLASADWREEPQVDFNLLSDQRDLVRLMTGFRRMAALHDLPPLKAITSNVFPASFTDKIRKVGDVNLKNRITHAHGRLDAGRAGAAAAIHVPQLHHGIRRLTRRCRMTMCWRPISGAPRSVCGIAPVPAGWEPTTIRWRSPTPAGRVRGVHGLRVVDASIFPVIPCANTNFPTMMVAEKIADDILRAA